MHALGHHIAATFRRGRLTIIRTRDSGPDVVIDLTRDEVQALFDYWYTVRPKPTIQELQAILDAEDCSLGDPVRRGEISELHRI